jgi:anti-sigma regulatory factor (Ser/Thr protein kinase)
MTHELPGGAGSIPVAREYARGFLERAEPAVGEATVQDALLAISELVTNVVRHAPGPCTLRLEVDEGHVHIAVSDTSSVVPRAKPPQPEGLGGFGLHMLRKLAGEVETRVHASGKTVSVSLARGRAG